MMSRLLKWLFPVLFALGLLLTISAQATAQCYNGRCYGPPVIYSAPVYAVPVYSAPVYSAPAHNPAGSEHPSCESPAVNPVLYPCPDPCFTQCTPQGCYRPPWPPGPGCPGYQPACQPPGQTSYRRTVGIGLNLTWNSKRTWR